MSILFDALKAIDVSQLNYSEWVRVGMSLKAEGLPCDVWDTWSQADPRYCPGECERKWKSFHGCGTPVTGGTIVQMAKDRGWTPSVPSINQGSIGTKYTSVPAPEMSPAEELITYLEHIFESNDHVAYVTNDVWQDKDGKWLPAKGIWDRTAGELISELKKHPNDIGAVLGDWKEAAGAWIRFNAVDGNGIKNTNITRFKYALIESDTMTVEEQYEVFHQLELPITCLVHSGGKSLHAIVRIDAKDINEYHQRVNYLYKFLKDRGIDVDQQNRNPSRLSRMPGVTRNGNRQYLVAVNMGKASWMDWFLFAEQISDGLPDIVSFAQFQKNPPVLADELIEGVLRCGHKMIVSGSSKAGKSFLLMELAIAIAEGSKWLGFQCKKGRVLYVNLEIDPASCITRFQKIYESMEIEQKHREDILIWNLRGHALPLDELWPKLVHRIRSQHIDAIILDPIYKIITGSENDATEMGFFCNQFDKICTETNAAVIYCHHHSKGSQGAKRAMDRSSGSGVFARDPDAVLDVIQLALADSMQDTYGDGTATAWRMECTLREFANFKPINFWFSYPLHQLDDTGILEKAAPEGSVFANLSKSSKRTTEESRRNALEMAYLVCSAEPPVKVCHLAEYLGVSEKTVHRHLKEFSDGFWCEKGVVGRKNKTEKKE